MEQFVDPAVSRSKFDEQIAQYRAIENDLRRRGWFLLDATFPNVFVVFASPKLKPPALVCGVLLNFENYDFLPPSVRLVDPFSREPYVFSKLPVYLNRAIPSPNPVEGLVVQTLMQASNPNDIPFFCIPGVREYHNHPGHTGDSWLMHRTTGEGTLFFILEQIYKYGVEPLVGYDMQLKISVSGFNQASIPQ